MESFQRVFPLTPSGSPKLVIAVRDRRGMPGTRRIGRTDMANQASARPKDVRDNRYNK